MGLPTGPSEYSERNERVVSLVVQHCRGRAVDAARLRSPKAHSILQARKLFARGLKCGEGRDAVYSALAYYGCTRARQRRSPRLRRVFASFSAPLRQAPAAMSLSHCAMVPNT